MHREGLRPTRPTSSLQFLHSASEPRRPVAGPARREWVRPQSTTCLPFSCFASAAALFVQPRSSSRIESALVFISLFRSPLVLIVLPRSAPLAPDKHFTKIHATLPERLDATSHRNVAFLSRCLHLIRRGASPFRRIQ